MERVGRGRRSVREAARPGRALAGGRKGQGPAQRAGPGLHSLKGPHTDTDRHRASPRAGACSRPLRANSAVMTVTVVGCLGEDLPSSGPGSGPSLLQRGQVVSATYVWWVQVKQAVLEPDQIHAPRHKRPSPTGRLSLFRVWSPTGLQVTPSQFLRGSWGSTLLSSYT